jgi:hypothetical protein
MVSRALRVLPLAESSSAAFNAAGRAVVTLGPSRSYERWHITLTAVQTTSTTQTTLKEYRYTEAPNNFIEGTSAGNLNSSDSVKDLSSGERITYVWTNGTPGSVATVTIRGDRTL